MLKIEKDKNIKACPWCGGVLNIEWRLSGELYYYKKNRGGIRECAINRTGKGRRGKWG
jgi:hypothetical protein